MSGKQRYSYIRSFKWVYSRLQPLSIRQLWLLFFGMAFTAGLETLALGSVAFFASCMTDPNAMIASKYVKAIQELIGGPVIFSRKELILGSGIAMVSLILLKNSFRATITYWIYRFGTAMEAYFGRILIDGFLKLPYQWHLSVNSADLINSLQWRVYLGRNFFQPCLKIFNNILMVVIMLAALFVIQPLISLIVIAVIGTSSFFIYKIIRTRIDAVSARGRDYAVAINKEVSMAIQGIKDVKISRKEDLFTLKFSQKADPLSRIFGTQELLGELPVLILETIGFGLIFFSIFFMLVLMDRSTAYVTGVMTILAVTAWKALPAINRILRNVTKVRNSLPYLATQEEYIETIENHQKGLTETDNQPLYFSSRIDFSDVGFSYKGSENKVLDKVDFYINKGETVGIIGKSGAGKSTLVDLLIGLLAPTSGAVLVDGTPLDKRTHQAWLSMTGYVPQSSFIYDGTLAENIAFGIERDQIDRKRVLECCHMAAMDDFVDDLPDSIDSRIGERGVRLSGGQQQRVAIARALYNKPEVMIFDEATSALDSRSEKAIQKTIYSFKGKQTLIIIAHRLSTLKECDSIIWIESGKIKMKNRAVDVLRGYEKRDETSTPCH
jgi:ABC-type multidrug transport system fused ATPase/permease subunit